MKDEQTKDYVCTGVLATADEIQRMKAEHLMPMARIGGRWPEPEKVMHEIALAHGLPEIKGHYGCDFRDGEFLRLREATDEPPDSWPKPETIGETLSRLASE